MSATIEREFEELDAQCRWQPLYLVSLRPARRPGLPRIRARACRLRVTSPASLSGGSGERGPRQGRACADSPHLCEALDGKPRVGCRLLVLKAALQRRLLAARPASACGALGGGGSRGTRCGVGRSPASSLTAFLSADVRWRSALVAEAAKRARKPSNRGQRRQNWVSRGLGHLRYSGGLWRYQSRS